MRDSPIDHTAHAAAAISIAQMFPRPLSLSLWISHILCAPNSSIHQQFYNTRRNIEALDNMQM